MRQMERKMVCRGSKQERKSVISVLSLYSIQKSTIDKREALLLAEQGWQSRLSRATGKVK